MLFAPNVSCLNHNQELRSKRAFSRRNTCTKGPDSVDFGIKHVQALPISYTATSKWLKEEYENYAWKRKKASVEEDDHLGIEDPGCANHAMSAARYFLTEMVKANADPEAEARERERARRDVSGTRQRLTANQSR